MVKDHPEKARALALAMIAKLDGYDAQYPVRLDGGGQVKPNLDRLPAPKPDAAFDVDALKPLLQK